MKIVISITVSFILTFFIINERNMENVSPLSEIRESVNQMDKVAFQVSDSLLLSTDRAHEKGCLFNDDYETLTLAWMQNLGISQAVWDNRIERAKFPVEKDTIVVYQGGCNHFNIYGARRFYQTNLDLNNHSFWISEAKKLAKTLEFKHYYKILSSEKLNPDMDSYNDLYFPIKDDNLEDNLYYTGVEIMDHTYYIQLTLYKYYN